MPSFATLISHHAIGIATFLVTLALASRVLRRRRPAGTSTAWLLGCALVPYIAIPLFLVLGERKLRGLVKPELVLPGSRLPSANASTRIEWLDKPMPALERFLAEARGATRSIHVSTFILGDDATGHAITEVLTERAKAGVEVRLLLDGLFARRAPHRALRMLRAAGGQVAVFRPLLHLPWRRRGSGRDHRKLAIFDRAHAIVGGMNLSDDYMGATSRWRDLSILVDGTAATGFARVFDADWEYARGGASPVTTGPDAPSDVDVIPTGPDCAGDP